MRAENVVIGGGPAGAAAACALARAGRDVLLLERNAGPAHKVCGDFLSHGAACHLAALGLDQAALGAETIDSLRIVHGSRIAEAALPFPAYGLSRQALDEALLHQATATGAVVLRPQAARAVRGGEIEADGLGLLRAGSVFLATGKHELRGAKRSASAGDLIGFKTYYRLAPAEHTALRSHVEIVLFRGGYAGLQRVEGARATLCLLVSRARFAEQDATWEGLIRALLQESPHLARRLAGAVRCLERPLAIAAIPFGFLHREDRAQPPRLYRLGDQAGVIPSLVGDGVATALYSGRLAASMYLAGLEAQTYHRTLRTRIIRPVSIAMAAHWTCRTGAQPWVVRACRVSPSAMRLLASWTRIPARI